MKKFLCGVLTLATIMPLATACGGGGGGNDTGDGKTLEIAAIDKGLGVEWLQQAADDYNFLNGTNITIKPDEGLHTGIAEKLTGRSRESDVYFVFSSETQWVEWYVNEYIVDLEDIKADIHYRDTEYAKLGIYEGKRVIMPYGYPPTGFIYNQSYINDIPSHGQFTKGTFPTTWQGLLDMCYSIKNKWTNNVNNGTTILPMAYGGGVGDIEYIFKGLWAQIDPVGFKAYWNQEALPNVDNDENKNLLVNENVKKAMESVMQLIDPQENNNGYCPSNAPSDASTEDNLNAQQDFLNGNVVFTISGAWFENEMKIQIEEKWDNPADRFYHFAAAPIVNAGGQSTIFINSPSEYFLIADNGKNRNVSLAKDFLKYLAEEEQAQIFHSTTGTPCAMEYEIDYNSLTVFQQEIATVAETAVPAIGASDKLSSLSGILKCNFNRVFQDMATMAFSKDTIASKLEELYRFQKEDWEDYITQFE